MTKAELVSHIADQNNITRKTAEIALKCIIVAVHETLKQGENIRIHGLGTFRVAERKERSGSNPRTGNKITMPAMKVPRFSAARALKEAVKAPAKKATKKAK